MAYDIELEARQIAWTSRWQEAVEQSKSFLDDAVVKMLKQLRIPNSYHINPRTTSTAFVWSSAYRADYERTHDDFVPDEGLEFYVEMILGKDFNNDYLRKGIGRVSVSNFRDEQEVAYQPRTLRIPNAHFTFKYAANAREIYENIARPFYNILVAAYESRPLALERRPAGEFLNHNLFLPAYEQLSF